MGVPQNFRERETELVSDASAIIVYKLFAGTDAWDFDEKVAAGRAAMAKAKGAKKADEEERRILQVAGANGCESDECEPPPTAKKTKASARTSLLGGFRASPAQKRRRLH